MEQNELRAQNEGAVLPDSGEEPFYPVTTPSSNDGHTEGLTEYEFIDSRALARRLTVPSSWIRIRFAPDPKILFRT